MKLWFNAIISLYVSFIIFTWFSFFFGPDGYVETQRLKQYLHNIENNTAQMEKINKKLEGEVLSLQSDPDTIALEARRLGYYPANDGVIYLNGYKLQKKVFPLGSLYKGFNERHTNILFIRYFSLTAGLLVFLLLMMFERKKNVYPLRQKYSEI